MIYLWKTPENFSNQDIGEYNKELSSENFLLWQCKPWEQNVYSPPVINFDVTKKRLLKFDSLPINISVNLVNNRIKHILEQIAPNDVQFIPARLLCKDGELDGYYLINILHSVKGIDHEKSVYKKLSMANVITFFRYLTYKPGCLGHHYLARDQEFMSHILVSEKIKTLFYKENIKGVRLVRPEDYYGPIREI